MAATSFIALRCGGGKAFLPSEDRMVVGDRAMEGCFWPPHLWRSPSSVAMRRWAAKAALTSPPAHRSVGNMAASTSVCVDPLARRLVIGGGHCRREKRHEEKDQGGGIGRDPVFPEMLDEWMRGSIAEIVKNIGAAPFLVHVFSNNEGPAGLRLEREAAEAECWPHIRRRWSTGAALPPDGLILVEELKAGEEDGREGEAVGSDDEDASCGGSDQPAASSSSSSSKTWGVVVQGRGAEGAACYILSTCRVRSSIGFCTHFCLARAKCFGDTADAQLKKAWLLRRKHAHQQQQQ